MKIKGFNMEVTFESVLLARKGKQIEAEARRRAEEALADEDDDPIGEVKVKGSYGWIKYYAGAKKMIKEQLTNQERKEFQEEVMRWRASGVPSEVKAE